MLDHLHREVRLLYQGRSRRAARFRYAMVAFDLLTIAYFVVTMPFAPTPAMEIVNAVLGGLIALDLAARFWIEDNRLRLLGRVDTLADIAVIVSLLLSPLISAEIAFLRLLRGLRIIHAYQLLRDLRRDSRWFRRSEDTVIACVNLLVFLLVVSSATFALYFGRETGVAGYIDALYFTVATLTTTGFGDITPQTPTAKLLSVVVMLGGVALFVRLAQAVFRPTKVRHKCDACGLLRHEEDAVHCKHCGAQLNIETEGL